MNTISDKLKLLDEKMSSFEFEHERVMIQMRIMSEVEQEMDELSINEKKLAELTNLSASFITQLFRGHKKLNLDTIAKFQIALNKKFKISLTSEIEPNIHFSNSYKKTHLKVYKNNLSDKTEHQIAV